MAVFEVHSLHLFIAPVSVENIFVGAINRAPTLVLQIKHEFEPALSVAEWVTIIIFPMLDPLGFILYPITILIRKSGNFNIIDISLSSDIIYLAVTL